MEKTFTVKYFQENEIFGDIQTLISVDFSDVESARTFFNTLKNNSMSCEGQTMQLIQDNDVIEEYLF